MNNIRPIISYQELLAARQHANLLLEDLRNDAMIEDIKKNNRRTIKSNISKELKDSITHTQELINKIDKVFIQQALAIEFQMDINYPQL